MTDKEKIHRFIDDFSPSDIAGMLKGATRKKISFLHKKVRTHANQKAIEQQMFELEMRLSKLLKDFPDARQEQY